MARISKPSIAALLIIGVLLLTAGTALAAEETPGGNNPLGLQVKSAFLMDAETGQVLYDMNSEEALPPASMSKMMTEYIVMEEIADGNLSWDEVITVQHNAATTTRQGSHVFLAQGDQHTVEELFIAMAVGSANDASIALAEHIEGSEEAFARRMNETAEELGLETAHFINATGLNREDMSPEYQPQSIGGETIMSAKDAAMLAYYILDTHDEFLTYSSIPSYKFRERDKDPMINYNWMLEGNKDVPAFEPYVYEGLDGMKTGHTSAAKYCFTGTAERDGMRLISVVMGAQSEPQRFLQTAKLLDYGFTNFETKTVVAAKSTLETLETVPVSKGVQTEVPIVTESGVSFLVEKEIEPQIELLESTVQSADELVAPIATGTVVGQATYQYTDSSGATLERTVNLVTSEEVKKGSWWRLMFRAIGDFFSGLFNGIVDLF
ncbi:D-alanyl-D-alanine carboxypeptidase [Paenibacillus sp. IB182496]|uniref:serine-type D-Ala-D-Ala carboxypeptidase n=2 Tax=Paenibacillus sabuli TaxID=2772509 RepID=A0A927GS90_9BACL|nr:D-alanyl-D-alanine carboxypeptidase [Paenibacillus sabuli]